MIRLMIGRDLPLPLHPARRIAMRWRLRHRGRGDHRLPEPARLAHPAQGRDPRPGRPGRLGPHLARPHIVRHRSHASGASAPARRCAARALTARGDRGRASISCRKTASAKGSCSKCPIVQNITLASLHAHARLLVDRPRCGSGSRPRPAARLSHPGALRRHRGGDALGRQPAEGRAGEMAVDAATRGDLRRADTRHRCRRQTARSTS